MTTGTGSETVSATESGQKSHVLVICNTAGEFGRVFSKIRKAVEKAPKADVLLIGQFFGSKVANEALMETLATEGDRLPCSVNVFVSQGERKMIGESVDQIGTNIFINSGLNWLKTASGVRVTFWTEHITAANAESSEKVLSDSLTRLSASPCDVLLTASFPLGVYNFAAGPFGNEDFGNLLTSKLAKAVSPKYHFCPNPSGVFHQRYPYRNDKILTQKVTNHTRFITLGNANNSSVKWFYLFSLDPSKLETCDVQTECPYTAQMFEQRGEKSKTNSFSNGTPGSDSSVNSFRWQSSDTSNEHDSQSPANKRRKSNQMASRECWFCLKSESCAKHLIVYVNDNNTFYIALAKGGIHAQHVLIVPVDHHRSAASLPDSLDEDLDALKTCICKFFKQQNKVCVMYERSYSQMHFVLQVVAIDENLADFAVPTFFSHANKINGISIEAIKPPNSLRSTWDHHNKCNYFHVEFPSGEEFFIPLLIHNFPINFGRQILCDRAVLKCPENVDWKTCVGTQEEEEKNRNDLRTQFDSFLDTYD